MPPKLGQIVETILYTSDVARLADWYKEIMGIKPFSENPRGVGFSLPNDTILLLFDRNKTTEDTVLPNGLIPKHGTETGLGQHMAFACASADELAEWEEHFKAKDVTILGKMDWELGGKSIYVKDWEGHVIEVMTRGVWPVY
ncbi:glyoxalase/bleomycin resistance protein/dioxygenase [Pochonia chlamydosporia 170]|uniref:Glyoxalase/bleomycin resistance protein/dioxygenase n=1 Tax=Pochonia chlamydosporia 170 TaxID=1380566 RepID=A0A179F592_METCM|nr:glyoxalase/bleomycin resistance protein/dioxygenase [Pochonia chlamydosporia 170]OAQ60594.1 glyoxalase/bleomycin resistance protein/dioxygenase [Pochonia chlamydosporia 170]